MLNPYFHKKSNALKILGHTTDRRKQPVIQIVVGGGCARDSRILGLGKGFGVSQLRMAKG